MLVVVYLTTPGQKISKSTLLEFRVKLLDQDDAFQPQFCSNIIFYGSAKGSLQINPDTLEQLAAWHTETQTFVEGDPAANVAPGPYVVVKGKIWQSWRIYYDFNATVITAFKPSPDGSGR